MSAYLDALSGAGYGDAAPSMAPATMPDPVQAAGGGYFSGLMQSLTATGMGYLSRRIDIDLAGRLQGTQPQVMLPTNQQGIGIRYAAPQPGGVGSIRTGLDVGALLPFALVAVAVFIIARRA